MQFLMYSIGGYSCVRGCVLGFGGGVEARQSRLLPAFDLCGVFAECKAVFGGRILN